MTVSPAKRNGEVIKGKYDIRLYIKEGNKNRQQSFRVSANSLLEAYAIEYDLKNEFNIKQKNNYTISAIWEHYLPYLRQNAASEKTIRDKYQCFMVSLLPFFGNMMPDNITGNNIEEYKKKRLLRSPGRFRQINKELIYLSAMINWASDTKRGLCNRRADKYDKIKIAKTVRKFLTKEQVFALLENTDKKHRLIFLTMSHAGLRIAEALGLRWKDVNLESGSIKVFGKGSKERVVPMPPLLKESFQKYKDQILTPPDVSRYKEGYQKRRLILANWDNFNKRYAPLGILDDNSWCFPNYQNPENHLTDIKIAIHAAARRAGLGEWVTPHILRHSYATMLLRQGVDILKIQALLGHEDIHTTQIYAKVDFIMLQEAVNKL